MKILLCLFCFYPCLYCDSLYEILCIGIGLEPSLNIELLDRIALQAEQKSVPEESPQIWKARIRAFAGPLLEKIWQETEIEPPGQRLNQRLSAYAQGLWWMIQAKIGHQGPESGADLCLQTVQAYADYREVLSNQ